MGDADGGVVAGQEGAQGAVDEGFGFGVEGRRGFGWPLVFRQL